MEKTIFKVRKCNRCGSVVSKSVVEGYSYSCDSCDEDMYSFETDVEVCKRLRKMVRNTIVGFSHKQYHNISLEVSLEVITPILSDEELINLAKLKLLDAVYNVDLWKFDYARSEFIVSNPNQK